MYTIPSKESSSKSLYNKNNDNHITDNRDRNSNNKNYKGNYDSDDSLLSMGDLISQISTQYGKEKQQQKSSSKGKQRQEIPISLMDSSDDNSDDDDILLSLDQLRDWESDSSMTNSQSTNKNKKNSKKSDKESQFMQKNLTQQEKLEAKRLKELEKEHKRVEKEKEKQLKELEKEQKRIEKEKEKRIQQVNRLKLDRLEIIKEMIVVINDSAFLQSNHGQLLVAALKEKEVQSKLISSTTSPLHKNITLKWQRKTKATWSKSKQQFIPFEDGQERIQDEQYLLIFLQVERFIEIVRENDMDTWIDDIKGSIEESNCDDQHQIFLMIEGLESFYRKKINWQRRKFASRVLGNMNEVANPKNTNTDSNDGNSGSDNQQLPTNSRKRKRNNNKNNMANSLLENGPTRAELEETLTYLQIMKDIRLIISAKEEDSIDWMISLTADLARSIYYNITTADFYKSQAPAKSGVEPKDIWAKMLQEIQLCTPAVSDSIIQEYPTLMSLYKRYKQLDSTEAEYLLADLEVERSVISNRDRTINKSMSKKIHKIFTSDDPTDIIA
ncbi:unnamed protein product [Cunninghamella echinulata]